VNVVTVAALLRILQQPGGAEQIAAKLASEGFIPPDPVELERQEAEQAAQQQQGGSEVPGIFDGLFGGGGITAIAPAILQGDTGGPLTSGAPAAGGGLDLSLLGDIFGQVGKGIKPRQQRPDPRLVAGNPAGAVPQGAFNPAALQQIIQRLMQQQLGGAGQATQIPTLGALR
jgi:hypothetical protein